METKHILIVDDEEDHRLILADLTGIKRLFHFYREECEIGFGRDFVSDRGCRNHRFYDAGNEWVRAHSSPGEERMAEGDSGDPLDGR